MTTSATPQKLHFPTRGRNAAAFVAVVLAGMIVSCRDRSVQSGAADGAAEASASASDAAPGPLASGAIRTETARGIGPVYPVDTQGPMPLAEQYCNAALETTRKRRDQCCPAMGSVALAGECIRTLSSALRSGAVVVDAADIEKCAAATTAETTGCDWVTSVGTPTSRGCLGILHGTLAVGASCRSSLECADNLRCLGLGATNAGKCSPSLPPGGTCNIGIDSLASFTGQDDVERQHPECTGFCRRRQCVAPTAIGGACEASFECGAKANCIAGKCTAGPLPVVDQPCSDVCAPGARCWKGTCKATKEGGASCTDDGECRVACEKIDGQLGHCKGQCPSFPVPPKRL